MTDSSSKPSTPNKFQAWEGSSAFVEQGRHWSSAFIWLTAGLFGCSLIWLFTAKVDQTISVRGQIKPSGSVRELESPSAGVVLDLLVSDGEHVILGQPLLTIEAQGLSSRLSAIEHTLLLVNLEASSLKPIITARGNPELFGPLPDLPRTTDIELSRKLLVARNQTQQVRSQLKQLFVRIASKRESLRLEQQIVDDLQPLFEGGGIARNAYLKQINSLQELKADVVGLEAEVQRVVGTVISKLNDINRQSISLRSELVTLKENIGYRTVKAPISGTVFDVKVSPYSVVGSSEQLLKIVPANKLIASIEIPNSDIGFVKIGQPVSVAIDSFPSGEFGYLKGTLISFGSDVLPPDRDSPVQYFPGLVSLKEQTVLSGSQELNLQSGMAVTANIKLRSRRAITLLTDIFTKQFDGIKRFR